jgi:hypothetical protein
MADVSAQHPALSPATVADVMHPAVTTVSQNDHVAAAAYLMKCADATGLIVTQAHGHHGQGDMDRDGDHAGHMTPRSARTYENRRSRPPVKGNK